MTTTPTERQAAALRDCAITRWEDAVIVAQEVRDADRARVELDKQKVAA